MREMKDSGIEWIGEIPKEWEIIKNKYLLNDLYSGGTPTASQEEFYSEDGIPFVSIGDMSTVEFVTDTKKKVTAKGIADKNLRILDEGTILYSIYATIGAVSELKVKATISQAILALNVNNTYEKKYYKYNLQAMRDFIRFNANGNTQFNLNAKKVWEYSFVKPTYSEQQRIADFLDAKCAEIDEIVQKTRQTIEEYKVLKQSVITEAVTKGIRKNRPMKDSGIDWIGEIPQEWSKIKLKYCTYIRARLGWKGLKAEEYVEKGYPLLSAFNIVNSKLDFEQINYINQNRYDESPEIMLKNDDILLVKDGAGIGKCAIVEYLDNPSTVNGSLAVITIRTALNARYLYYYFLSEIFQKYIDRLKDGMGVPHLFQSDLREIQVVFSPASEQQEIVDYLDEKCSAIDKLIAKKETYIEEMEAYKKSLIYEYVTGKKEV